MPQNVTRSAESRLLSYDRKARAELGTAALLAFLAVAAAVGFAFVLSRIIARVFIDAATLSDVHALLFLLCALALLRAGLLWASEVASQSAANRLKDALATDVLDHIARLGPAYIHRQQSGELAHTVAQGVEQLDEYVTSYQPLRGLAVLVPVLVASVVLFVDPWSVLILVLTGPLLVLFLVLIGGRTREITERRSSEMAWMSASFVDLLQGLATLKLFGRSSEQTANIREISKRYSDTSMTVLRTAFETSFVLELGASIAMALVAVEIGIRLLADNIAFANALAVLIITPEFFLPLRQLATKYHAGAAGKAAATRLFAILDTSPGGDRAAPAAAYAQSSGGDIRLVDIAFSYDVDRTPALDGVSLEIPAGRVTALVGPTGSGKSTIANLLLRFVEAGTGTIFVDGTPLSAIGVEHWRSQVSWVPQHPHLFYGTVIENIRLGRASATDDEVVAAARAAQAHEFITELPHGYETQIGERGARLSGGEKQRVAIARAFLKDAPLLILDEPTSHLDAENESSIRDALGTLMRGRTVLLISHRPELASLADHVVEMRRGRVARRDAPPPSSDEASPAAMDPAVLLLPNTGGTL